MNIRALVIAVVLLVGASFTARAQQFTLVRSVIGSGATPMQGTVGGQTFTLDGTIGQAVIGPAQGSPFSAFQGFWYTLPLYQGVKTSDAGNAEGFSLEQNYPNPFNPSTTIYFSVPSDYHGKVTIRVMNLLGEEVKVLFDEPATGRVKLDYNADDLPSGTYIYRMDAGNFSQSKRMVLLK